MGRNVPLGVSCFGVVQTFLQQYSKQSNVLYVEGALE